MTLKTITLFIALFFLVYVGASWGQLVSTDSLRVYWKMDEGSGNIVDIHNSITGTANGDGLTYSQTGVVGTSIDFAGSDDYFSAADNAILQIAGDMSISIWMNVDVYGDTDILIEKRDVGGANYSFYLDAIAENKIRFYDGTDVGSSDGTTAITTDSWFHVGISISGGTATFYVNSVDNGNQTFTITKDDAPLYIGVEYNMDDDFNGTLDEIGIWSRALTSTEWEQLYNDGRGLAYPLIPYLTGIIPKVYKSVIQPKVKVGVIIPKVRSPN